MIISASYRSDIPAFHGPRFLSQLDQGFAMVRNPYNGREYRVSLQPEDVNGFIFWTRNARPFRAGLKAARAVAPLVVQYTITGYPNVLERGTPPAAHGIAEIRQITDALGKGSVVWRYDPVIWTDRTDTGFHRDNFCRLADQLSDQIDEVTFSAATLYAKSRRNLAKFAPALKIHDPADAEKQALLSELATLPGSRGMTPTLCSQPHLLSPPLQNARCIDSERLQRLGGPTFRTRQKGNRRGCDCAESRDIGAYDSCAHGCFYCYAVNDHDRVKL